VFTAGQFKKVEVRHLATHAPFPTSALKQVQKLFKSEFSTQRDLVLIVFDLQYPPLSLNSSSSCLLLIPRLPVSSTLPSTFRSITSFRRQHLCKMWPIKSTFPLFVICKIFLYSFPLCNTSFFTRSVQLIYSNPLQFQISKIWRRLLS